MRQKLALACHAAATLMMIGFGVIYLTRSEFMPYHRDALGMNWADLDGRFQTLLLALLRLAGGGFVAAGTALLIILAIPFRRGERWAGWAVPGVGLVLTVPTLHVIHLVQSRTPGRPPLTVGLVAVALLILGFILSRESGREAPGGLCAPAAGEGDRGGPHR